MNWYFEDKGVAQGPMAEPELESKVRAKALTADALIWHVGLPKWQTVGQLRPKWLEEPKPAVPLAKPMPAKSVAAPGALLPKPKAKAAVSAAEAAQPVGEPQPVEKQGLLKRLFGGISKKK